MRDLNSRLDLESNGTEDKEIFPVRVGVKITSLLAYQMACQRSISASSANQTLFRANLIAHEKITKPVAEGSQRNAYFCLRPGFFPCRHSSLTTESRSAPEHIPINLQCPGRRR